jgi:hypothetical protein
MPSSFKIYYLFVFISWKFVDNKSKKGHVSRRVLLFNVNLLSIYHEKLYLTIIFINSIKPVIINLLLEKRFSSILQFLLCIRISIFMEGGLRKLTTFILFCKDSMFYFIFIILFCQALILYCLFITNI